MKLTLERWYPTLLGAGVAVAYLCFCWRYRAPEAAKDLLGAGISIGAIAVGFLANTKAILFSIDHRRTVGQLREVGYFGHLVDYLVHAIKWSFALALASAAGLMMELKSEPILYPLAVAAWLFLAATALASYYRVISIFAKLLRSP